MEKKLIYLFDTNPHSLHIYRGQKEVVDDYKIQYGETDVKPFDKNNYWNGYTWVDSVTVVYLYNPDNGYFTGVTKVPRGTQLQPGETIVKPKDGLYKAKFDGTTWTGISKEEYESLNPIKPTAQQELMANTLKKIVSLQADHQDQQKLNASLMVQNANLKKDNNTQERLNADLVKQIASLQQQVKAVSTTTTAQ